MSLPDVPSRFWAPIAIACLVMAIVAGELMAYVAAETAASAPNSTPESVARLTNIGRWGGSIAGLVGCAIGVARNLSRRRRR